MGWCVAFTGGLIGDKIYPETYAGDFQGTPIFIGTSNPDPHVPVERVKETTFVSKKDECVRNGKGLSKYGAYHQRG